jgi:signal peptide peptidase SppA
MYPNILRKVFSEPWLVLPATHQAIQQTLLETIQKKADHRMESSPFAETTSDYYKTLPDGVAYVQLYGVIGKHLSGMEMACGGCSLDYSLKGLIEADKDPAVKSILLDISSPGGTVTGVAEFANMIKRISATTPVYAFTENLCCSAAMWIASACSAIIATPSATVGSIGVYMAWFDDTAKNEKEGRELILFEAGDHKAIGLRPPTAEEREMLQAEVEELHEEFKAAVREGQGDIEDSTMQGLTYSGSEGVNLGLVDALVICFDDALELINS